MHKIKVVHVTQSLGGVKTYIEHLINYSNRNQFEYEIFAPAHEEFQDFCKSISVAYHPVQAQRTISVFKDLVTFFKIVSKLRKLKPDILHVHSAKGGYIGRLAAKVLNIKVIYSPHAFSYLSFKGLKRIAFYALECMARPFTDILLSVSYSEANRAIHEVGFQQDKVKVILNAIPIRNAMTFRNYETCERIGMIGRLTQQKNPILFLKVASELLNRFPHLSFSILGAGMTDTLVTRVKDHISKHNLGEKVEILRWGDNRTSADYLNGIDVFMLTSVFEGLPFSLVEAMASGVPCVVSKADGNTDVIHNGENGFACLSVDEFVDKVVLLIGNEDLRRHIGQAGHRYVKKVHDIRVTTQQLEELYLNLFHQGNVFSLKRKHKIADALPVYPEVSPSI